MANGMGSLYIGASGLQNSQNALNTTANNLANVETKGYVRQQVLFEDRDYVTFDRKAAISDQQGGRISTRHARKLQGKWRISFRS